MSVQTPPGAASCSSGLEVHGGTSLDPSHSKQTWDRWSFRSGGADGDSHPGAGEGGVLSRDQGPPGSSERFPLSSVFGGGPQAEVDRPCLC